MKKLLTIVAACAIVIAGATDALAKRKHVRIHKPSPKPAVERQVPLAAVPVIAVAFDIARRTSCDPRVAVGTGKGDPGFDLVDGPKTGNFLIPAIYRSECLQKGR